MNANNSNNRNENFLKQIKWSFLFRILTVIISFILVPIMLKYLGNEQYGMWSVLLALINWILFFDLGLANSVKNKVAECYASKDYYNANVYLSTGYYLVFIFSVLIYIIFFIFSEYINWQSVFNTYTLDNEYLKYILNIIVFSILVNFILSIIDGVLNAVQKSSFVVFKQFIIQLITLILVLILFNFTSSSLLLIAVVYGFSMISGNLLISYYFYKKNLEFKPSFKNFDRKKIKFLFSLGMKFFFLQFTFLIIMTTDKMIITQILGPTYVTNYEILFKYFSILMFIHGIINSPLWPMYSEAYKNKDFKWIKNTLLRMNIIYLFYILIIILFIYSADIVIPFWLKDNSLQLSFDNYIYMGILVLSLAWSNIYSYFLNGLEKLNIQLITNTIGAIINIPLSIYFTSNLDMGINGVLLATIISLSIFNIFGTIQTYFIIKNFNLEKKIV